MKQLVCAIAAVSLLTACIDSDSDSDTVEETTTFDGKVADGYLVNAKVCLDLNSNNVCDSNEPYATSSAGGDFSLSGVTQSQVNSNPILVEVIAGETYDEDAGDPAIKIQTAYKLSAPAGSEFVSPITTLIKTKMDDGQSLQDAIDDVRGVLGAGFDPTLDYVAAKESNELTAEERALYEKGHKTAQVIASLLADELASTTDLDDAVTVIESKLQDISDEITNNPNATADDIANTIDSSILSSENLAGVWVGEYLNNTSGSIAGAYILNSDGSGMFLDGFELNDAGCMDMEMEFNWTLSGSTLNLAYTGVVNGQMSVGDGDPDTEIYELNDFTGDSFKFPPKEVGIGPDESVTLTKQLTRSVLSSAVVQATCSGL